MRAPLSLDSRGDATAGFAVAESSPADLERPMQGGFSKVSLQDRLTGRLGPSRRESRSPSFTETTIWSMFRTSNELPVPPRTPGRR